MRIGELASRTGCRVQTIRYYEMEGLLQAPVRGPNNYRDYDEDHLHGLSFILACRSLDMTHDEIRTLLQLQDDPARPCDDVGSLLDEHTRHVEARIAALQALREQLQAIRDACAGRGSIGECRALEALKTTTGPSRANSRHVKGAHR